MAVYTRVTWCNMDVKIWLQFTYFNAKKKSSMSAKYELVFSGESKHILMERAPNGARNTSQWTSMMSEEI